jgi:acyl carrier protein
METKESILSKLKQIAVSHFGVEESKVQDDSSLTKDLEADSLDAVEFFMEIESVLDVEIPDEKIEKLQTLKDIADFIFEQKSEQK